ncbi:exopolysaccharide biosynthesis polyprenyl glycosylphosphotransferase [Pustulibacterium marinum]|uniref:Exopolysaccharide biosynthesis polyprenyl glycosylphosphotransferase n=1 Tax=Pustulibacterium marinum TaxID=1224947 RepID=A0A1I7HNF4_9FLAO|nr:sugar transferase [Pustulibacterium marinum]SFU62151.1 exopolysaccharide biosynthesis polyprenyl glycosylphosphotransferase [Pustulibacterium marinum]
MEKVKVLNHTFNNMSPNRNIHFELSERIILLRVFDNFFIILGLIVIGELFQFDYFLLSANNWYWIFVLLSYFNVFGTVLELYNLQKASRREQIFQNVVVVCSLTTLVFLLTPFFTPVLPDNRLQIVYFYLAVTLSVVGWRFCYIYFISSPRFYKNIVLVGTPDEIQFIGEAIKREAPSFRISGVLLLDTSIAKLNGYKVINPQRFFETIGERKVSEIIIASNEREDFPVGLTDRLILLLEKGIPIREYTQVYEELTSRVPLQYVGKDFYKYFPFSRSNQNQLYLFFSRVIDVLLSIIGLLLFLIWLPIVLVGNFLGNKGPLFYVQERVGKGGELFKIYKLRSMVVDAEKSGAVWAQQNDPRITPFGQFLRKSRLDEMPQFINVLKGEMSMIGPRPERPVFVKNLAKSIPFYEVRHMIKPGVTGWAQVSTEYGASEEDSLEKLQYDLYYIKHRSAFMDINIIFKTLSTILFYRGR